MRKLSIYTSTVWHAAAAQQRTTWRWARQTRDPSGRSAVAQDAMIQFGARRAGLDWAAVGGGSIRFISRYIVSGVTGGDGSLGPQRGRRWEVRLKRSAVVAAFGQIRGSARSARMGGRSGGAWFWEG
jgi:hypothetical protein